MSSSSLDDVEGEVRRILSTNSVDQCIAYNQKMKKEIAAAQEELRDAIGKRYRELIVACDRVVGMEDVCHRIQQAQTAHHQHNKLAASSATAKSQPPSATSTIRLVDPVFLEVASCREMLAAIRVLLRNRQFAEAVCTYRQLSQRLERLKAEYSPSSTAVPSPAQRVQSVLGTFVDTLQGEFYAAIVHHICDLAANGPQPKAAFLDQARDWHAALELLCGCPPDVGLNKLVDLHRDAIARLVAVGHTAPHGPNKKDAVAVQSLVQIRTLGIHLTWYVASLQEIGSYAATTALSLGGSAAKHSHLALGDLLETAKQHQQRQNQNGGAPHTEDELLRLMTVQLCATNTGVRRSSSKAPGGATNGTSSPLWGLSPPATTKLIPSRATHIAFGEALHEALRSLIPLVTSVPELSLLEPKMLLTDRDEDGWSDVGGDPSLSPLERALWNEEVQSLLSQTVTKTIVTTLGGVRPLIADAIANATQSAPTSTATTGSEKGVAARRLQGPLYRDENAAAAGGGSPVVDVVDVIMRHCVASRTKSSRSGGEKQTLSPPSSPPADGSTLAQQCRSLFTIASSLMMMCSGKQPGHLLVCRARRLEIFRVVQEHIVRLTEYAKSQASSDAQTSRWAFPLLDVFVEALSDSALNAPLLPLDARESQTLSALREDLEKTIVLCHRHWLTETTASFLQHCRSVYHTALLPHLYEVAATVRAVLGAKWSVVQVDDARILHPVGLTSGLSGALLALQSALHKRQHIGTLHPVLVRELATAAVRGLCVEVQQLIQTPPTSSTITVSSSSAAETKDDPSSGDAAHSNATTPLLSEEIVLQLAFDMTVVSSWFPASFRDSSVKEEWNAVLQRLQELCDVVSWNLVFPLIESRAQELSGGSVLGFGLLLNEVPPTTIVFQTGGSVSAANQISNNNSSSTQQQQLREQLFEREMDRLPLLPITTPTQVRTVMHAAASSGAGGEVQASTLSSGAATASAENGSSTLWSATSKLRSVAAFWGAQ